jgi:flavodoxin
MKTLVVYDSQYGNTESVAQAIADAIGGEVPLLRAGQVAAAELESADLLILGAPTHGALPSEPVKRLLAEMGPPARAGSLAATFDTRLAWRFLRKYGYAADRIAESLQEKGWTLLGTPGGFFVRGLKRGPLKKGELERTSSWAQEVMGGLEGR